MLSAQSPPCAGYPLSSGAQPRLLACAAVAILGCRHWPNQWIGGTPSPHPAITPHTQHTIREHAKLVSLHIGWVPRMEACPQPAPYFGEAHTAQVPTGCMAVCVGEEGVQSGQVCPSQSGSCMSRRHHDSLRCRACCHVHLLHSAHRTLEGRHQQQCSTLTEGWLACQRWSAAQAEGCAVSVTACEKAPAPAEGGRPPASAQASGMTTQGLTTAA